MIFKYGIHNKIIDITDIVYEKCLKDNIITIPKNDVIRKNLFGDPWHGKVKFVYINNVPIAHNKEIIINLDKKVCICFYGLTRSLKYTINSIRENIIKVLINNHYNFDIYLHTYNLHALTNKRSNEKNVKLDTAEYKKLGPDKYCITNQSEFDKTININNYLSKGDPWPDNRKVSLLNLLRQLNSLKKVTELHLEKEYNAYIYLRPDLKYINKLNIDIIKNIKDNTFYTPIWGKFRGLNDRLCIGKNEAILKFGNRLDEALKYSETNKLHSERFLKNVMKNFKIININLKAHRVRANGIVKKDC